MLPNTLSYKWKIEFASHKNIKLIDKFLKLRIILDRSTYVCITQQNDFEIVWLKIEKSSKSIKRFTEQNQFNMR